MDAEMTAVQGGDKGPSRAVRWAVMGAALLCAWFFHWTVSTSGASLTVSGEQEDYYNLLVDGFQRRQLAMNAEPHPELLRLSPPERPGDAPFLLDASLYQGKYYLYFGAAPAVLLYWPFANLIGHDLPLAWGALLASWLALALMASWWLAVRAAFFPRLGAFATGLGMLALGGGTGMASMLRRPSFYEVAIAFGLLGSLLAIRCLTGAILQPERRARWLLVAGLGVGLAAASRSSLIPAGIAMLVVAAIGVAWNLHQRWPHRLREVARCLALAGACTALVGGAMALYNQARFGDPLDFGYAYQLGPRTQQPFKASNARHNVPLYYFTSPSLNAYFPFVAPGDEGIVPADYLSHEHVHGQAVWLPCFGLAVLAGIRLMQSGRRGRGLGLIVGLLVLAFAINLGVLSLASFRANRYMLDFHPLGVMAVLLAAYAALATLRYPALPMLAVGALLAVCIVFNSVASMQVHGFFRETAPRAYQRVAQVTDQLAWPLLRHVTSTVGDRVLRLQWPRHNPAHPRQPILAAGSTHFSDVLWIECLSDRRARFVYQHGAHGEVRGDAFEFAPESSSEVRISGALLLPAPHHPWYGDAAEIERLMLKRELKIWVDGELRFERDVPSYASSPHLLRVGAWKDPQGRTVRSAGPVSMVATPALARPIRAYDSPEAGPWRLRLRLPSGMEGAAEPLVSTGTGEAFDVLAVWYVRPGVVRLMHDKAGAGARYSVEFAVDPAEENFVEINGPMAFASVHLSTGRPHLRTLPPIRLSVRWNGRDVFESVEPPHPIQPGQVYFGYNAWTSSGTRRAFSGDAFTRLKNSPRYTLAAGALQVSLERALLAGLGGGDLLNLVNAEEERAALVWSSPAGSSTFQLGWLTAEAQTWTDPLAWPEGGQIELQLRIPESTADANGFSTPGWVNVDVAHRPVLSVRTALFEKHPVVAGSLVAVDWRGSGRSTSAAPIVSTPATLALPGRMEIRFALSRQRAVVGSDPLLSVGRTQAADSVYLQALGENRYRLGLDHWGVGAIHSEAFELEPERIYAVMIELGSLKPQGVDQADTVRVSVDGKVLLDARVPLYPVDPDTVVVGANPLGMSTSSPRFSGDIVSIRRHLPPRADQPPGDF